MSVEPTPIYERQHREEIDFNWGLIGFIAVVLLLEAAGLTIWHHWMPIRRVLAMGLDR